MAREPLTQSIPMTTQPDTAESYTAARPHVSVTVDIYTTEDEPGSFSWTFELDGQTHSDFDFSTRAAALFDAQAAARCLVNARERAVATRYPAAPAGYPFN